MIQESKTPQSGTDYSSVINPYNQRTYNETPWDRFVSSLGFRSSYDKAEAERLANYNLWESQHSEQQRQELYNSASEVKQREEEAGLNPALSGQTIGGGSSDALNNAPNIPTSIETNGNEAVNFAQHCLLGIQTGIQFATGLASLTGIKIGNNISSIQQALNEIGLGEDYITKFAQTLPDDADISSDDTTKLFHSFIAASADFLPKKMQSKFRQHVGMMWNSDYGKYLRAKVKSNAADSVVEASAKQRVLTGFDTSQDTDLFIPFSDVAKDLSDVQYSLYLASLKTVPNKQLLRDLSEFDAAILTNKRISQEKKTELIYNNAYERYMDKIDYGYKHAKTRLGRFGWSALGLVSPLIFEPVSRGEFHRNRQDRFNNFTNGLNTLSNFYNVH